MLNVLAVTKLYVNLTTWPFMTLLFHNGSNKFVLCYDWQALWMCWINWHALYIIITWHWHVKGSRRWLGSRDVSVQDKSKEYPNQILVTCQCWKMLQIKVNCYLCWQWNANSNSSNKNAQSQFLCNISDSCGSLKALSVWIKYKLRAHFWAECVSIKGKLRRL